MAIYTQIKRPLRLKMPYKGTLVTLQVFDSAITANVTTTSEPVGSLAFDTTVPSLFISDGTKWQALATQTATPSFTTLTVSGASTLSGAVTLKAATEVVTTTNVILAAESGTTYFLNAAGGFTSTLPAVAAGLHFTFVVQTAPTTAYIVASATNDNIIGWPIVSLGSDETANGNAAADQANFVANVSLPGDRIYVICDGTSWHAVATAKATGAITFTG